MALELSEHQEKVVMAHEPAEDDSRTTFHCERALGDTSSGTGVASSLSTSPTKRLKKDVVGEQEVQDFGPQGGKFNASGEGFAEGDGDVGCDATDKETASMEEPLKGREGRGNAGDRTGSPNPERCNVVQAVSLLLGVATEMKKKEHDLDAGLQPAGSDATSLERADQDSGTSSEDTRSAPGSSSAILRQQNDPELREKIHKVEVDYWQSRTSRDVYNEERFKLYSEEELQEKHIVWPRREVFSPAGYREDELEVGNHRCFGGPSWDDLLFEFGCPFDEEDGDEEAAKKRWRDGLESKFKDPEAKMAEYKRWEKIREVETEYYYNRIERDEYNERRLALYTEEEREQKGVVWPHGGPEDPRSPAGYRDFIFEDCDEPDWQSRMQFHWPYALENQDTMDEENLCELCIPLIEENKAAEAEREARRKAEYEALRLLAKERLKNMREAATGTEGAKKRRKEEENMREEKAKAKPHHCAKCNRKFATECALRHHAEAKQH